MLIMRCIPPAKNENWRDQIPQTSTASQYNTSERYATFCTYKTRFSTRIFVRFLRSSITLKRNNSSVHHHVNLLPQRRAHATAAIKTTEQQTSPARRCTSFRWLPPSLASPRPPCLLSFVIRCQFTPRRRRKRKPPPGWRLCREEASSHWYWHRP